MGHIRDLPRNAADVPEEYKGESWARTGVDVDNDFKPLYIVTPERRQQVSGLKKLAQAGGRGAARHRRGSRGRGHRLAPARGAVAPASPVQADGLPRDHAPGHPPRHRQPPRHRPPPGRRPGGPPHPRSALRLRGLPGAVAQGAAPPVGRPGAERGHPHRRRARVGAHALRGGRLLGRRRHVRHRRAPRRFGARLVGLDGRRAGHRQGLRPRGPRPAATTWSCWTSRRPGRWSTSSTGRPFEVAGVESRPYRRSPAAPFITSTLQQEAGRKLRLSSAQAMRAAQSLYEQGFITYMRTDSTTLSDGGAGGRSRRGRRALRRRVPARRAPPVHEEGQERAGGARGHPARRRAVPAAGGGRPPGRRRRGPPLRPDLAAHGRLADDRRRRRDRHRPPRGVAPPPAAGPSSRPAGRSSPTRASSGPTSRTTTATATTTARRATRSAASPPSPRATRCTPSELEPKGHTTQPPPRYTEASLVKRLEELGVGRPSTYASIMSTIQDRGYVWKQGRRRSSPPSPPSPSCGCSEEHFPDLVDYAFTARMEDDLDDIAAGDEEAVPWLSRFYFGRNRRAPRRPGRHRRRRPAKAAPGPGHRRRGAQAARLGAARRHRPARGQRHPHRPRSGRR